ncbi:MAG: protein translocase subunit SecF [Candidatus Endonucleobacter bathymodioli]|uniref:Protein-export membrane protein SecF n=1 Tax=Candidatus Endonucleibacter bathymodioli TaxID=539814 RepID=A0AA90NP26_9GAMM|nr:protein translocase subunit SecF [Candidatus Endonucleobacter bathymodioli]
MSKKRRMATDKEGTPSNEESGEKIIAFMKLRTVATALSIVLLIGSVFSLAVNGIKWGLDFTGGTQVELFYEQPVDISFIRELLANDGHSDAIVKALGSANNILVTISGDDAGLGRRVAQMLDVNHAGSIEIKRVEYVGPQVGDKLREQGALGMLLALLLVMLYIAFRFQFKFSVGAVTALTHDSIIVLGVFSFLGLQFDLTVLAAILAVIGYSLNDTIIVYDRIRENFRKRRKGDAIEIINVSLSQTLGRTLATSGTTLMVLLSLFLFGGDMIHNFATALIVGIGVGTYSSIYIASSLLLYMNIDRADLVVSVANEEKEEVG